MSLALKRLPERTHEQAAVPLVGHRVAYFLTPHHDLETEAEGVRVVCDAKSAVYLRGSVLEYTGNLIGGGFKFENPNAARACGCGTSFTLKA